MMKIFSLLFIAVLMGFNFATAQTTYPAYDSLIVDYSKPVEYTIGGITVSGTQFLDKDILISLAGIKVGDRIEIPGQEITKAIQNLWKQELFANVRIYVDHTEGDKAFLAYVLDELLEPGLPVLLEVLHRL